MAQWYRDKMNYCLYLTVFLLGSVCKIDGTQFCNYFDPCLSGFDKELYPPERRDVGCQYQKDHLCDDLMSSTWYRMESPMLNYCPGKSSCGALYPIWLNGDEPTNEEEIKEEEVCVVGLSSCCERQYTIKMKKCKDFVAYCLPSVSACPERYCFGNRTSCEIMTSSKFQSSLVSKTTKTNTQYVSTTTQKSEETTKVQGSTPTSTKHTDEYITAKRMDAKTEEVETTTVIAVAIVLVLVIAIVLAFILRRCRAGMKKKIEEDYRNEKEDIKKKPKKASFSNIDELS